MFRPWMQHIYHHFTTFHFIPAWNTKGWFRRICLCCIPDRRYFPTGILQPLTHNLPHHGEQDVKARATANSPWIDHSQKTQRYVVRPIRWHIHVISPRIRHNCAIWPWMADSIPGVYFRWSLVVTVHGIDILRSDATISVVLSV
jgi:hypothetical protein